MSGIVPGIGTSQHSAALPTSGLSFPACLWGWDSESLAVAVLPRHLLLVLQPLADLVL